MRPILLLALLSTACTPATQQAIAQGQAVCARAAVLGPPIVTLVEAATGKPWLVTGRTAATVAAACALVQGIPVVPPPGDGGVVPGVAVRA